MKVRSGGKPRDAVAQPTKQGWIYLFDRVTGEPLFPVRQQEFPSSDIQGEITAKTQQRPLKPEPFARQLLTEDMLTNRTPAVHDWALQQFRQFRSEGQFVPLRVGRETVIFPGFDGGAEWGGSAFDPETGLLYINSNDLAWTASLRETDPPGEYRFTGYHKFLDPDGYPAVAPPWGTLNAINLHTGDYAWKVPLGEYPELAAQGVKTTGTENYGGPLVTAGGLVFIAATNFDNQFRAFDKSTGKQLWHATLPMAGNATPITYSAGGQQYIVICATGGKSKPGQPSGGVYVAFRLGPRSDKGE